MKFIRLSFLLLLISVSSLFAESITLYSIEWLADSSDAVAIARVEHKINTSNCLKEIVSIQKYLKSKIDIENTKFSFQVEYLANNKFVPQENSNPNDELLIFVRKNLVHFAFNLTNLSHFPVKPINSKGKYLKSREEIVKIILERVKMNRKLPPDPNLECNISKLPIGFLTIFPNDCDVDSYAFDDLIVPADPDYKEANERLLSSEYFYERCHATAQLVNYFDKKYIPILENFLLDSKQEEIRFSFRSPTTYFPLRQAAFDVLNYWGLKKEKPNWYNDEIPKAFYY